MSEYPNSKDNMGQLNGLFKGIGSIFNIVDDMISKGENLKKISNNISVGDSEKIKASYDLSFKLGLDNAKSLDADEFLTSLRKKKLEPLVDVFEEDEKLQIIIMTKNIEEKDIKIRDDKERIIFEADNPSVSYYKEIPLPYEPKDLMWTFKNGVVKISICKYTE